MTERRFGGWRDGCGGGLRAIAALAQDPAPRWLTTTPNSSSSVCVSLFWSLKALQSGGAHTQVQMYTNTHKIYKS